MRNHYTFHKLILGKKCEAYGIVDIKKELNLGKNEDYYIDIIEVFEIEEK